MSEWLVRVRDKVNPDKFLNAQLLKRGDVVVVCPDGHGWSKEERFNPDWRILKFPDVSVEAAEVFLAPELEDDPKNPNLFLQRRAFKLDLDSQAFEKSVSDWLKEDGKVVPADENPRGDPKGDAAKVLTLTEQDVFTLKVEKPRFEDPGENIEAVTK